MVHAVARFAGSIVIFDFRSWGWRPRLYAHARNRGLRTRLLRRLRDRFDVYSRAMRVLGIDPGSQTTGWGVVEGDGRRYSLVAFGAVRVPSKLTFSARLLRISNGLEEVIAQHRPDACALEDAFLATNVKVSMK